MKVIHTRTKSKQKTCDVLIYHNVEYKFIFRFRAIFSVYFTHSK